MSLETFCLLAPAWLILYTLLYVPHDAWKGRGR